MLAAHEPVSVLNLGIVAKIDLSEIRSPFLKAAAIAGFFSIIVVLGGAAMFLRISNPMIRMLEKHNIELAEANNITFRGLLVSHSTCVCWCRVTC